MSSLKERSEIEEIFKWDLSPLYAGDDEWETALREIDTMLPELTAFKGTLSDAASILNYFKTETDLSRKLSNLFNYASLRNTEDTRAAKAQSMYSRVYAKYVQIQTELSFAVPEILSLSEKKLQEITDSQEMEAYRYQMTKLLRQKPHVLSEKEEKLLAGFGEVLGAPSRIAGSLRDADMKFASAADKDDNPHEVTESGYILLQMSKDRELRKNAFESYYEGYKNHINTYAAAYAGQVKASVAEAAARNYSSSREMYMADENIPAEVYDNLIKTVHEYMPLMYKYVELRKKILGVSELHYYDIYAPLSGDVQSSYTYEEAKEMVLETVKPLGEGYVDTVKQGFRDRWIDVYPNKGKRGGAYSSGTYDSYPYIMTNFVGSLDSVSTLAHEMGHSMHTWLSNHNQQPQNADYTIFVAEVASTVNENMLVEQLLDQCDNDAEKMALLNQYMEGFKGTVYRQTMFAEFERDIHAMAERGEALNAESISAVYKGLIEQYFGPELVIDDCVAYEWARIPHFYTPFYVYKYATSYAASVAVSENILSQNGGRAAEDFLKFLSLGGSMDPLEELKTAGVDLSDPEPIRQALEKFGRVIEEAFRLSER